MLSAKKVVKQEFKVLFQDMSTEDQMECIEDMEKARDTGVTGPVVQL